VPGNVPRECDVLQQKVMHSRVAANLLIPRTIKQQELTIGKLLGIVFPIHTMNRVHAHQRHRGRAAAGR